MMFMGIHMQIIMMSRMVITMTPTAKILIDK